MVVVMSADALGSDCGHGPNAARLYAWVKAIRKGQGR